MREGFVILEEPFSRWHEEGAPLFRDHWREVGVHREVMELEVDVDRILELERLGMWRSWTVRQFGSLYGYCCVLVAPHLHYRSHRVAFVDVVYLAHGARSGGLGYLLLRTVVDAMRGHATKMVVHVKLPPHDFGPLLSRLGFAATETNYERLL